MYPASQPAEAKIFSLPSEIVEEALVVAAAKGFPSAIATFGCSCHHFYRLVFQTADHHLWREVFLTTFDDPRPVLRLLGNMSPTGPGERDIDIVYDWAAEFKSRMDAARLFRKLSHFTPDVVDLFTTQADKSPEIPFTLTSALETILDVLETATPFPAHCTEPLAPTPSFPPIMTLHASPTFPPEFTSRNVSWVDEILTHGYPPCLVKKYLLAGHQPSRPLKVTDEDWCGYPEEGQVFHKLVFRKGFIPVPEPGGTDRPWKAIQSSDDQSIGAREVARSKVYNLRYLRPERSWGPFIPASGCRDPPAKPKPPSSFPDFEQELSRYMLSNYIVQGVDDSDDDDDFIPDDEEDDDEGHEILLEISGPSYTRRRPDPKFVMPRPHEVVPDYTYLSAARMLIEMDLREMLVITEPDLMESASLVNRIVDALASLEFGRMGGAPAFWESAWGERQLECEDGSDSTNASKLDRNRKGKKKATDLEWVDGWDWAGATGQWIRVVCWLDYRDLLLHNLHGYTGDEMAETIHLFPMDIRIAGYSKPPEPDSSDMPLEDPDALVWKLPVIHLEGEARGRESSIGSHMIRKITGTVRMLKAGVARWSLTSSYTNEDAPEWAFEGIQVGSIGSAVGMLALALILLGHRGHGECRDVHRLARLTSSLFTKVVNYWSFEAMATKKLPKALERVPAFLQQKIGDFWQAIDADPRCDHLSFLLFFGIAVEDLQYVAKMVDLM
ncbi:hypothetical protein H0H92_015006 [Tricholoma furcatifolium]|nr:hypothetical protein H0H92_015006 [Tricholoma furcatifolium]